MIIGNQNIAIVPPIPNRIIDIRIPEFNIIKNDNGGISGGTFTHFNTYYGIDTGTTGRCLTESIVDRVETNGANIAMMAVPRHIVDNTNNFIKDEFIDNVTYAMIVFSSIKTQRLPINPGRVSSCGFDNKFKLLRDPYSRDTNYNGGMITGSINASFIIPQLRYVGVTEELLQNISNQLSSLPFSTNYGCGFLEGRLTDISSSLITPFPVYGYGDFAGLKDYLDTGNYDDAINKDDIDLMQLVATNWTVYIDGRNPAIVLTWQADALADYIIDNQDNYKLSDVKVETQIAVGKLPTKPNIYDWQDHISTTFTSDWISLRYLDMMTVTWGDRLTPQILEHSVARLKFRIKVGKSASSWCEFGVAEIGKENPLDYGRVWEGNPSDGSTVTLVYNTLPDDNEYKDPSDDSDVDGSDTQPEEFYANNTLTTSYQLSKERLQSIGNFLWHGSFVDNIKLLNNNPIENVLSCKYLPIKITGTDEEVVIGNVESGVNGIVIDKNIIIDIGTLLINGVYNSFLDFSPFTKATIFLPFIGFKEINLSMYMYNNLNVKYVIDAISGSIKAMLFCNNIYVQSFDGYGCIDITITASNRSQVESSIISQFGNEVIGSPLDAVVGAGLNAALAQYHYSTKGTNNPTCSFNETSLCYIIFDRPVAQYPDGYGHNVGYPCNLSKPLSVLSGYTICSNGTDVSGITATETERREILNYLTTGVYL